MKKILIIFISCFFFSVDSLAMGKPNDSDESSDSDESIRSLGNNKCSYTYGFALSECVM